MINSASYSDYDINSALYGNTALDLNTQIAERLNSGAFGTPEKPKYTRVSGVLFSNATYLNVHKVKLKYYKNPYAEFPFSFNGAIDEVEMDGISTKEIKGKPLNTYFAALSDWTQDLETKFYRSI